MELDFEPGVIEPESFQGAANWFVFVSGKMVILDGGAKNPIPYFEDPEKVGLTILNRFYLGKFKGEHSFAVAMDPYSELPTGFTTVDLRFMLAQLPENWFMLAGRAQQIIDWDLNHQFCGRCGARTQPHASDRAKECPECGHLQYPRLSPCIIVLITRGEEVLLGRSANFPPGLFSTLAGFIEPGETLEIALAREVQEEVGVKVKNIQYVTSQPWPFPNSLMIGFHAEYDSGDIVIDEKEIVEAGWWPVSKLPMIPPVGSISRNLIDHYVAKFDDQ